MEDGRGGDDIIFHLFLSFISVHGPGDAHSGQHATVLWTSLVFHSTSLNAEFVSGTEPDSYRDNEVLGT